ncbi:unnamed protein product, partial [Prunus brigantina]
PRATQKSGPALIKTPPPLSNPPQHPPSNPPPPWLSDHRHRHCSCHCHQTSQTQSPHHHLSNPADNNTTTIPIESPPNTQSNLIHIIAT